jgi:hypothetical protein
MPPPPTRVKDLDYIITAIGLLVHPPYVFYLDDMCNVISSFFFPTKFFFFFFIETFSAGG